MQRIEVKEGYRTSEFWLNVAVFILGALLVSGGIADGGMVAKIVGGLLSLLSGLGYGAGRVGLKKSENATVAYVVGKVDGRDLALSPTRESI